jgi:hypothetical protein
MSGLPSDVVAALEALPAGRAFTAPPASDDEVRGLEEDLGRRLPGDVVDLLRWSNGVGIARFPVGFYMPHVAGLRRFAEDPGYRASLPGMVVVADDGGTGLFFVDDTNQLRLGAGAAFLVDRGDLVPEHARLVGASTVEVVRSVLAGEDLRQCPTVTDLRGSGPSTA